MSRVLRHRNVFRAGALRKDEPPQAAERDAAGLCAQAGTRIEARRNRTDEAWWKPGAPLVRPWLSASGAAQGCAGCTSRELFAIPVTGLAGTQVCPAVLPVCSVSRCSGSTTRAGAPCAAAGRVRQVGMEVVEKAPTTRRPAESSRGGSGGGTLSQPAASWVTCSCEKDASGCFASLPSRLGASLCRPCGGLRALREAMSDCDGFVTVKLPPVTSA